MSWLNRLIPHGKAINLAKKKSQEENLAADQEQALVMEQAVQSSETADAIKNINYKNGFSVALGYAFANKEAT